MTNFSKLVFATLAVATIALMTACGSQADTAANEAQTTATATDSAVTFTVDTTTSIVNWVGKKSFSSDRHTGTIKLSEGSLQLDGDNIAAGSFVLNMNTINSTDLQGEYKMKLESHLKTGDFFEVAKFPTAKFDIVSVNPIAGDSLATHEITGNLTMRDATKSITFKANVTQTADALTASTTEFTIDRTQWNVMFHNGGVAGLAKDEIISNDITLTISLTATKAAN